MLAMFFPTFMGNKGLGIASILLFPTFANGSSLPVGFFPFLLQVGRSNLSERGILTFHRESPANSMIVMTNTEIFRRDIDFFNRTVLLASQSDYAKRVGCIAAINNKHVCGAFNTQRNAALHVPFGEASRHAEWNCLRLIQEKDYPRVTLYIARINTDGMPLPSRPCVRCMTDIREKGVQELVYVSKHNNRVVKETLT